MENTEQEKKEVQETTPAQPQVQPQKPQAHKKIKCKLSSEHLMWIAVTVLVLGVLASYGYKQYREKVDIGENAAKKKIQKFLSENVPSTTKTEIKSVEADGSLYKVTITLDKQEIPVFITRDGKKFIDPSGVRELEPKEGEQAKKGDEEQKEIPKAEKPKVDLYVMSFCPFGNKAEDTLKPVYELLKNKVDFNFHYIVSSKGDSIDSLHGEPEVLQNEREACVMKLYGKDQWMNFATYVNEKCGSKGECWEAGAKSLKIDVAKVNACVKSDGVKLMKADEEKSKAASAQGSPTMLINGVSANAVYQYGNSEAYKKAICDSFTTAPAECSKALSSSTSTAEGGSCGN